MKIVNNINEEIKSLTFYYYETSMARNPETPGYSPLLYGNIDSFINFMQSRINLLKISLTDTAQIKSLAPSQYYAPIRNKWSQEVEFFCLDIDTTIGTDQLFGNMCNSLLKTFKNIVYIQKSWSGKIHICLYVKTEKWSESKWKERSLFWAGYINEWCINKLNINYLEITDNRGKSVIDTAMFRVSQPFKISDNDLIFNPYFTKNASSVGSSESDEELIKGSGLSYKDLIKKYKDFLNVSTTLNNNNLSILDYSKGLSFSIGKQRNQKYTVTNNTRLYMVSALMAGNMSDDDILKLLCERTMSSNGGDEHNRKEIITQIKSCRNSINNAKFKNWVSFGLSQLKRINVIYQAELKTDNIKQPETKLSAIQLDRDEYISTNHLNTLYNEVQNNNTIIVEAPTGTGKTEAAKRLSSRIAKDDYISLIVTNTCALSGEYGKDKSIKSVTNLTTSMSEGKVYSMVFDKFVSYFPWISKKKVFIIIDEVHTVTEHMTFREVCIALSEIMDEIKELPNIKLMMMSATLDYLTVSKFQNIAKTIIFDKEDTRKFQFTLIGGMDLKQAIIKAEKDTWADHICIFSDTGVGMLHTRAITGNDNPSANIWKGVSFDTGNNDNIGYYVSKNNANWKTITRIDELVLTERMKPRICMCTSAIFAGTNVKNEHEKFLILIDYSEFVSSADVRQILGRFRSDTNEYKVIILLNDNKWADWRDFGGLDMYRNEKENNFLPEIEFISTTTELRKEKNGADAYWTLINMSTAYQHSNVNKMVFDYFMSEHMTLNENGLWLMSYKKLLSALKLYDGPIMFGSDFMSDGTVTIKDDTLCISKFIDLFFKEYNYNIDEIKNNCQQRAYEKHEANPNKKQNKPKYVDTSIDLSNESFGIQDVSTWFDSSNNSSDISSFVKVPNKNFKNVFEDKIKDIEDFKIAYRYDIGGYKMAFDYLAKTCKEIFIFTNMEEDEIDYQYLYENFNEAECDAMCGLLNNADKTVRDIIYNDRILAPIANEIIKIWQYRTERTAQAFIKHMRYTFGAYTINEEQYNNFILQINKNIDIYEQRLENTNDKYMQKAIMGDIAEERKAINEMAVGREMRDSSISALSARIVNEYLQTYEKISEGNKKGGKNGSRAKACSVIAVYNDGHSVKIEARSYEEMFEKIKELCGGTIYGNTDRAVKDWIAGRSDKMLSCKALGIKSFEKCLF